MKQTTVIQIDPSQDKRWDALVMRHPDGLIYHHSLWKEVIEKTYGYDAKYFAVIDAAGEMKAGLPFFYFKRPLGGSRLISLPLSDFCNPLFSEKADLQQLCAALFAESRRCNAGYLELRTTNTDCSAALSQLAKKELYANHLLELQPDPSRVLATFTPDIRRAIRKAQKQGLRAVAGQNEADLKTFYRLYVSLRKRHGLLPQPYAFFANIRELLEPSGAMFVTLVYNGEVAVASTLNLLFKNRLYLLYAGSDADAFQSKSQGRDHLITWTDIVTGIERGAELCDFGRTAIGHTGLMRFKKKWGTSSRSIYQFSTPETGRQRIPEKSTLHGTVLQKMTQNMPEPVLEFSGRLLYKYFL